jgi:AcrR family transcriptional regulator
VAKGGRTHRGRQTRARIVAAAARLFAEHGYLNTTMGAIAAEAGVAVQTLYLAFGSKVAILEAAHDVAVVGDDEPVALLERPWVADLRAEPDGPRALELAIANTLRVIERVSAIHGVIQFAAADPEVAELLARGKAQRFATLRTLVEELAAKAGFSTGLSADRAADILYAVVSDELYRVLVVERHWSIEDWQTWAYESAALRLFPQSIRLEGRKAAASRS